MLITLQTDWWSRWNPWLSWGGWIAFNKDWMELFCWNKFYWHKTNNEAEFLAVINWATEVFEKHPNADLFIEMDSNMIVQQINWKWKCKAKHLQPLFSELMDLLMFKSYNAKRIPRELNTLADQLANSAMDNK